MSGRKDDSAKLKWRLLPTRWLLEAVQVMMHGAEKYEAFNWLSFPVTEETLLRFADSFDRHWLGDKDQKGCRPENGELERLWHLDRDSGLLTIDHLICCLMFIRTFMLKMDDLERSEKVPKL